MRSKLTTFIFIGMLGGIAVGYACNMLWPDPQTAKSISGYISLISDIFLRLIKMIIAPLVFSTLVVGIAHMGDTASVGRIGAKAMAWFVGASLISLLLGLVMVNILRPGEALNLPLPDVGASTNVKATSLSLKEFVTHLVPKSAVEAMANNEILQIVVFAIFFGVALAAIGEKGQTLTKSVEQVADVMLRITGYVMMFAPIAVFAAIAATITTQGIGVLVTYGKFMLEFYFSLAMLWLLLALAGFALVGGAMRHLLNLIKEPFALAFSTASQRGGVPENPRAAGAVRRAEPDHQLRSADGVLVQPRWLDDVLYLRDAVHRAGLQRRADDRAAANYAASPHGDVEGDGGRAEGLAGRDLGDAGDLQYPGGGPLAHHRHRPVPRHGPLGDERAGQQRCNRRGRQVGRPAAHD